MKATEKMTPIGRFRVQVFDKNGNLKAERKEENLIVNEGKDDILDVYFDADTQITIWYIGLINGGGSPAPAAGDTMASHAGWTEDQNYSEANRVTWPVDPASGQAITNTTTADFSINATTTIYGVFITSDNTKGGTSGTLWSAGAFSGGTLSVGSGDTIKVTYTVEW